ncbi:MAG: response regulator transcription factor [Chloroflexota bacterium]
MKEAIQILIVDVYAVVREGLRAFISTEPGMQVVGEAADGEAAVQECRLLKPDVVVIDIALPNNEGLDAIRAIKKACQHTCVLVLSNFAEEERVLAAMKAGAQGYMLKDATTQDVIQAIRDVYRGEVVLHPSVAYVLLRALQTQNAADATALKALTDREKEVLQLVARGCTNQDIATQLRIDERTVRVHVTHILQKLDLHNRTQAALFALRNGLAELE